MPTTPPAATRQKPEKETPRHPEADGVIELKPRIVSIFPHDTRVMTQGLAWYDGALYESASSSASSTIRRIEIPSGKSFERPTTVTGLADGIAANADTLHLLFSRHGRVAIHTLPGLDHFIERPVTNGGHGLTYYGRHMVLSDGGDALSFQTPGFVPQRTVSVRCANQPLTGIQEIEFGAGKLYAAVPSTDRIYEISPESGQVSRIIDCSGLREMAGKGDGDAVLNGIGYEPSHGLLYVSGRNWRYLFAIDITGVPVL